MSKFKFNTVIVGLFLLLGGCSSGMQSNNGFHPTSAPPGAATCIHRYKAFR